MNLRRNLWISTLALALAVTAVTLALRARSRADAARAAHAAVTRADTATNTALRRAEARLAATAARPDTKAGGPAPTVGASDAPSTPSHYDSHRAQRQNPELQALRLAADRAAFELNYAPLFRALKLSPAEAAQFCDHLMRRAAVKSDLQAAAEVQRLSDYDTAVRGLEARAQREYEEAQLALLGEAGARQAIEFERTLRVREGVAAIASTATLAGVPLTPGQIEQLLRTVVTAAPRAPDGTLEMMGIDWVRVGEQARPFLSPAQWAIFTSVETDALAPFSAQLDRAVERANQSDGK